MSFGIYEILLKSKKVRVFSNEVILKAHKNISNIKPLKLKSTATVEYIIITIKIDKLTFIKLKINIEKQI